MSAPSSRVCPPPKRGPTAVSEGGGEHRGGREQQVEQAHDRRAQQPHGDEPEEQDHPQRADRGSSRRPSARGQVPSSVRNSACRAVGPRQLVASSLSQSTRSSELGFGDRVALRLVRGQREEQFPVRVRRAQQSGRSGRVRTSLFEARASRRVPHHMQATDISCAIRCAPRTPERPSAAAGPAGAGHRTSARSRTPCSTTAHQPRSRRLLPCHPTGRSCP